MSYQFPIDIQQLIGEHMASGHYSSEDDLLRNALRSLADEADDLAAVESAIDAWRDGDEGIPLDEAFADLRKKHGIS